jgi:hypothetical protein
MKAVITLKNKTYFRQTEVKEERMTHGQLYYELEKLRDKSIEDTQIIEKQELTIHNMCVWFQKNKDFLKEHSLYDKKLTKW